MNIDHIDYVDNIWFICRGKQAMYCVECRTFNLELKKERTIEKQRERREGEGGR